MQGTNTALQGLAPAAATVPRRIAVIGAGFSGTTVALRLLRQRGSAPLEIMLIDPREELGAGIAYATRDYPYPLNVAAGQMSLDAAYPRDFLDFLCEQGIHAEPGDYLPRPVFGDYLRARFATARAMAPAQVSCTPRRARVLRLRKLDAGFDLWLDDGSACRVDAVVLALGNGPPACPPECLPIADSPNYVSDPWSLGNFSPRAADAPPGSVLLLGSGLTMIDAALRLAAIRPRVRHIHVLSRHGLLPLPQASEALPPVKPDVDRMLAQAHGSIRRLFHGVSLLMTQTIDAGGDWREVLALLRPRLPALWRDLDATQRARFLRHARSVWEVHRHRVPAGPLAAVRSLQRLGVLEIHAGRLAQLRRVDDAVEVQWRPRGAARPRAWLVERVVNCTGPDARVERLTDPLVQSLLANGLARRDALGLGIDVAPDGRTIGAAGAPVAGLYYIGPWLRARDWEATAVPELREHAAQLAERLIDEARLASSS
jgi:uncharacterized NAD(P)/FAD-binding protein YdhS